MDIPDPAPVYEVPDREVVAVEHPMIIRNIDNAIKTFGQNRPFMRVLESADPEQCIPLYLRYNDPMCVPILSHNSPTNNVLLKFTVPKRTGRKRKRGCDAPFTFPNGDTPEGGEEMSLLRNEESEMRSQFGRDNPSTLFRKISDNIDTYQVEAVAEIRQTHRYRGLSDFHHSTSHTEFGHKFTDQLLSGDIEKLKEFKFNPGRGWKPNEEFIPAPKMTVHTIPQNWAWHQNSNIHVRTEAKTGKQVLVNVSKPRKFEIPYLRFDEEPVPQESPFELPDDPNVQELIAELTKAFSERPIWSRRALYNHLSGSRVRYLLKAAIQHAGYQFRGGPFRECVIKYGLDPRKDPMFRKYQSVFFKVYEDQRNSGMQWHDMRTTYSMTKKGAALGPNDGHMFDGKKVTLDGKVWQLCDITDPLLASLIENSPCTDIFEIKADGWYMNGSMAKIRGIMRTKIMAIWRKKEITDDDFAAALEVPDHIQGRRSTQIQVPLPNDGMTAEEFEKLQQRGVPTVVEENGVRMRIHKGKMRSQRIRGRVGTQKTQNRIRKPKFKGTPTNAKPTSKFNKELQDSGGQPSAKGFLDPSLADTGSTGIEDDSQMMEGSEQDDDCADDDDEDSNDEDEDDEEEDQDDEEGLENIAAPILRQPNSNGAPTASTGDTSSRATTTTPVPFGSEPPFKKPKTSKASKANPKKSYAPRAKKDHPGSGTSSVNGQTYTPAPLDLSMYRNIAPRPFPT